MNIKTIYSEMESRNNLNLSVYLGYLQDHVNSNSFSLSEVLSKDNKYLRALCCAGLSPKNPTAFYQLISNDREIPVFTTHMALNKCVAELLNLNNSNTELESLMTSIIDGIRNAKIGDNPGSTLAFAFGFTIGTAIKRGVNVVPFFNKLDSNVMKEFASVIKSFDEAVKNKDVDGAIKSIVGKDLFTKIESLQYKLMDIFEIYSQNVFEKNFEFLQILKSENIDILFSDSSLLDQKTKNAVEKTFNNLNSSKTSYTEFMEVERIILRMQNRIVNVEKGTNEIILTLSKTLHLENFKSLLDFSPIMNENKTPLLKFIKLFLNKHVNLSDRIKRKIFNKHNIILSDIPNYFINKWSYLNLTDKEFKRYVMNQKINRKLKGK